MAEEKIKLTESLEESSGAKERFSVSVLEDDEREQKKLKEYLEKGYVIKVRILRKVEYIGDGFVQDANRLALAELEEIVRMQEQGYCLTDDQISEAVKTKSERQVWNDKFEN